MKIFISHASEDKDDVARPLAEALRQIGYEVWFDEYSLKLGDSLSQEIDKGLAECDYGVVIFSKSFLAKNWPRRELAGLVSRETGSDTSRSIILPIWHRIDAEEVRSYSPTLADRVAVSTQSGLDKVTDEIVRATEFLSPKKPEPVGSPPTHKSARSILKNIVRAGPIQPDGGLMPDAVAAVQELVDLWDQDGELSLLVKVDPMSREHRVRLFNEEKSVLLLPTDGMHQVRVQVIDKSYRTIGMVWTPPNISDSDYHKALEFFLLEMGFLEGDMVEVEVAPVINSDNSFWVKLR